MIREEYKEYTIIYLEDDGCFCLEDDRNIRSPTLQEIKNEVDKLIKKGFDRTAVLFKNYDGELIRGIATSETSDGYSAYITTDKGRRKESVGYLYLDNKHNKPTLQDIDALQKSVEELKEKIRKKWDSLEKYQRQGGSDNG